ncbi:MAG: tetratricopeptide repeat protein [Acidobacteriota bacterium]
MEEALELIQRALEIDPWNGAYLDSLGWAYFRMGRFEEAREPLEAAARELPADAVVLEHLGDLYERCGENELAIFAWGQALDNGSDNRTKIEAKIAPLAEPAGVDRR